MNNNIPFIDKYKPMNLDEIILNPFLKKKINNIIQQKVIPNLIITGSQSVGKSTIINLLCKNIYKKEDYKDYILELNASDDRGLNMINSTIIPFCKKKNTLNKVVILDEADSITNKAQNLLSNIISVYTKVSFVFVCIDKFKIYESIQSRCIIFNLANLELKNIKKHLVNICNKENITYNLNSLDELIILSENDIRRCINNLECFKYTNLNIDNKNIDYLFDKPKIIIIKDLFLLCKNNNLKKALVVIKKLNNDGYNNNDIILSIMKYLEYNKLELNEEDKFKIFKILSDCYITINNGVDSLLQVYNCVCNIYKYIHLQ
jgi:replication factor C subunit 2/4